MTERTTENVSEWMTIENLRTYLEELRDEHGEEHEFATRISSDCVVVKFIEDSLPGYKVGECNYGEAPIRDGEGFRRTIVWYADRGLARAAHPIGKYITRVDDSGPYEGPITVGLALSLLPNK